jgi:hypothetical protein
MRQRGEEEGGSGNEKGLQYALKWNTNRRKGQVKCAAHFDNFATKGVWYTDHSSQRHSGVAEQTVFNLAGSDAIPRALDDICVYVQLVHSLRSS